jgi:hypothetical protein
MDEQLPIADVPLGFFEYRAMFKEPIFSAWYDGKTALIKEMYKVLLPWGVDLEKISWSQTPRNLKEAQITFSVPNPSISVNIGIGGVTIIVSNADWSQASVVSSLVQAVLGSVLEVGATDVQSHQTVLGFHVKPGPKPFREVMKEFIDTKALGKDDSSMLGLVLYGAEHSILIDASASLADGLFVKVTRVFSAATPFEEMAAILWKDEESLLHRLGFRTQQ